MKLATLASGSSGNATLIAGGGTTVLVDAGLSGKDIEQKMESIGISPKSLAGIVVTHEHRDHTNGVGVLARRYKLPVYVLEDCLPKLEIGLLPEAVALKPGAVFEVGELKLELLETSHDSVDSAGVVCYHGKTKVGVATDTGVVTKSMLKKLQGCSGLVFESNHDEEMLWKGSYPHYLKRRIAASTGHLSNTDAARALTELIDNKTKRLLLAHLSEENNNPTIALETVASILIGNGVPEKAPGLKMRVAPRYEPLAVGEL